MIFYLFKEKKIYRTNVTNINIYLSSKKKEKKNIKH